GRTRVATARALLVGIVHQVTLVGFGLFRRVELHPVLQPGARRVDAGFAFRIVLRIVARVPAVHRTVAVHVQVARGGEGQVGLFAVAVAVGVDVEEARRRAPVGHHADHAEVVAGHADVLAHRVGGAV